MQVVAAFDFGGRPWVIRLLRERVPFDDHVCRGGVPRTAARAPVFRAIAKNGNLGTTALPGAAIHATIRRRAEHAGYDPTLGTQFGGHSLRAGFVTQGFRNGSDAHAIARQTGHSSMAMLELYARENAPLIGNAVNDIGYERVTGRSCVRCNCPLIPRTVRSDDRYLISCPIGFNAACTDTASDG